MMVDLHLPWRVSNAHGLCIVGSDDRLVADLTPQSDWKDPHDSVQLAAYAQHIVDSVNQDTPRKPALDITDKAIWQMARYNHTPEESWFNTGELAYVMCRTCHQSWPCSTYTTLGADGLP